MGDVFKLANNGYCMAAGNVRRPHPPPFPSVFYLGRTQGPGRAAQLRRGQGPGMKEIIIQRPTDVFGCSLSTGAKHVDTACSSTPPIHRAKSVLRIGSHRTCGAFVGSRCTLATHSVRPVCICVRNLGSIAAELLRLFGRLGSDKRGCGNRPWGRTRK